MCHPLHLLCPSLSLVWPVIQVCLACPVSLKALILRLLSSSSPFVIRAVDPQLLLQRLLLVPQLHGVHQVVDAVQGPHGRWEPGLYVAVLPHHQHAEIVLADLQLLSQVIDHVARQRLGITRATTWKESDRRRVKGLKNSEVNVRGSSL